MAEMAGALTLSRAVSDPKTSNAILRKFSRDGEVAPGSRSAGAARGVAAATLSLGHSSPGGQSSLAR